MSVENGQDHLARRADRVDTLLAALQDMIASLIGMSRQLQREIVAYHDEHAVPRQPGEPTVAALQAENAQLRQALEGRAIIERAKGMLMVSCGYDEDTAFERLVEVSRRERRKVRDVAATVVAGAADGGTPVLAPEPT
jgi:ANTAR domain